MTAGPWNPVVVGGFNKAGRTDATWAPSTGAIGPASFVQLVKARAGIFNRTTGSLKASGTLDDLAGVAASVISFDPQVIWDPTTNRFYYTMNSMFAATDQRLSWGFSKTSDPSNVTTNWCHYTLSYGIKFPDYPKLGDSQFFLIIGGNVYSQKAFLGSDLIAISKPAAGTACPAVSTFNIGTNTRLVNSGGNFVFTPVPANQIDTNSAGFVVARNSALPSNKLWFFNVMRNPTTGKPIFGVARGITVGDYTFPFQADQPGVTQTLDTFDARLTQAVQP